MQTDTEKDVKKLKRLVRDNGWHKAHALSFLHRKYQNGNRVEEAAIVNKLMFEEGADAVREYDES